MRPGAAALALSGDRRESLRPGRRRELAVDPHIGAVEPLGLQTVDDMARLVGNPFLVDEFVDARQDPDHFAPARIDADRRAERVHHVDRFGLGELPRAVVEFIGLGGQRADRAEVDDIALQLRGHRMFEIGGDLHVLAAADRAEFGDAGDLGGEANAARAMDAAVHRGLDQRADIFVLDGALVLAVARGIDAIGHRLVLQVAFAALVADRAIERMVDQQEFHHAFARLARHRRIGLDDRRLALRAGAQVAHRHRAGGGRLGRPALHLDEAHAAIAGDRQPLVEAEARNFRARRLAGLEQRVFGGDVDFPAVDDDLGHCALAPPCPARQ